jgi:hypothetical protein
MKNLSCQIFLLLAIIVFDANNKNLSAQPLKGVFEEKLDYEKFIDPPTEYRSFPFYSINDSLDADEIKQQIRDLQKPGLADSICIAETG